MRTPAGGDTGSHHTPQPPTPPTPPQPVAPVAVRAPGFVAPPPPAPPTPPARDHFRPDIEGLRGVAVLAVVFFHAWPGLLSGGFIGVDVFFVISGFLITGLLLRELDRGGEISFRRFYTRRVRRLFPAAALVLVTTFLLSAAVLSPLALPRVTADGVAAALSVANIRFALTTGDYFNAVATPSPFLHFWSLSVEEQFYLVWPALLLLVHRLGGARFVVVVIGLITVASLVLALVMTEIATTWAFYSLFTRTWQLAIGGLLAIAALPRFRRRAISGALALLGWAGLVLVVIAGLVFDDLLAYPGYWALAPTLGAVAVIAGGDRRLGPGLLLQTPPLRFFGRISYALYLWHWPLLILGTAAWGDELPPYLMAALVVAAVVVATLSTLLLEEPIRRHSIPLEGRRWMGMAVRPLLGLTLAVVVGASASQWVVQDAVAESERGVAAADADAPAEEPAEEPADIEGDVLIEGLDDLAEPSLVPVVTAPPRAGPTLEPEPEPSRTPKPNKATKSEKTAKPTPTPTPKPKPKRTPKPTPIVRLPKDVKPKVWNAAEDTEFLQKNGCLHWEAHTAPKNCVFGKPGSKFTIALVGDSHASHWFPALRRVADERGWRLETYVKVSCPFTDILVRNLEKKKKYKECLAFNENTVARLKRSKPNLVVTALSRWQHPIDDAYASAAAQGEGIARMLDRVPGKKVVIADVPYPGHDVPECLADNLKDIRPCAVSPHNRVSGGSPARERRAAKSSGGVLLDFSDLICSGKGRCPVVRNDAIIFRDHHHLTATFARSLAPALDRALQKVVAKKKR